MEKRKIVALESKLKKEGLMFIESESSDLMYAVDKYRQGIVVLSKKDKMFFNKSQLKNLSKEITDVYDLYVSDENKSKRNTI